MGMFETEIGLVLVKVRCNIHGPHPEQYCENCKLYVDVEKLLDTIDKAEESSRVGCAVKQTAIDLLRQWMAHSKGCTAKPEDDCKYCISLALAATSAMKKATLDATGDDILAKIKKIEAALTQIDKLGPEVLKKMNERDKEIKALTALAQCYYMQHSVKHGPNPCPCTICTTARPLIHKA